MKTNLPSQLVEAIANQISSTPWISIVVPCFNEEQVLPELCRRLVGVCQKLGASYEIILINDGSKDQTWEQMRQLAETNPHLVVVNLSRNHGHQLALSAGLSVCTGQRILIIDADLQDPPELLPEMLNLMDQGADVVYGQRRQRAGETYFKRFTARMFYRIIRRLTDTPIPVDTGDFRLMSRRALDVLLRMPERHRFIRGMVSWIGFNQQPILYDRSARFAGETKYPFRKMLRFAIDAVTAFSIKPLALASYTGFVTAVLAVAFLCYSFVSWLHGGNVAGWTSIMAGIALLGSVQLLVLGIFGEYLGRLYEQSKGRPLFIIENVVRTQPKVEIHTPEAIVSLSDQKAFKSRP